MTDPNALQGQKNETPEDVATLYSWANLHGAKYRDFSAARAQTREKARQRVQLALEEETKRARLQAETQKIEEKPRPAETPTAPQSRQLPTRNMAAEEAAAAALAEQTARAEEAIQSERAAQAAQAAAAAQAVAAAQAAQQAQQAAQEMARRAAAQAAAPQYQQQPAPPSPWQARAFDPYAQPPAANPAPYYPPQPAYASYPTPEPYHPEAYRQEPYRQEPPEQPFRHAREEFSATPQNPWSQPEPRETASRPAWLASERNESARNESARYEPSRYETAGQPASSGMAASSPTDDTLQGSRDRLATRWFALKGFFDNAVSAPPEPAPAPTTSRAPVVAVFSLAGGVGKTSLVATLGRALSSRGERVLLVDTATFGLLPFFFGAQDQRPGQLRTFSPPSGGGDAPIQMITIDLDAMGPDNPATETLTGEIQKNARGAGRIIVDLPTASGATTRRILKLNPLVLVPVIPDMNSVVSVGSIDSFFSRNAGAAGSAHLPYYVLNQFDPSLPLHLDVREVLRERLGDRLLPFALRRAPSVSEALAEGMTVMDYAPNSTVAEDFASLAGWVKSLSAAAASSGFRGVRWSER